MGPYHQLGHDCWNLVGDPACKDYAGAILSPVNYDFDKTIEHMSDLPNDEFEMIFDPQLYFPQSDRGKLPEWKYFPSDADTADLTSMSWWKDIVVDLAGTAASLGVHAVCSPAFQPRNYPNEYYESALEVADLLAQETTIEVIPTIIVRMGELSTSSRVQEIASIITGSSYRRVYLIFVCEAEPRREIHEPQDLIGAMSLITLLESGQVGVIVGYCCSDMILWRAAGASACATGKFFNLRRFTQSRFAPPANGGGQIDYWFEENLLAFLRQADIARAQAAGLISNSSLRNPASRGILQHISTARPWRAGSWRHYMWWFADAFGRVTPGKQPVRSIVQQAEKNWKLLRAAAALDESANDGRWIDAWLKATDSLP